MKKAKRPVLAFRATSPAQAELIRLRLNASGVFAVAGDGVTEVSRWERIPLRAVANYTSRHIYVPEDELDRAREVIGRWTPFYS